MRLHRSSSVQASREVIPVGILENFENAWDPDFQLDLDLVTEPTSLANKIFSETVCSECYESKPMPETDNMGREIWWED
jgi:hypothetical protein